MVSDKQLRSLIAFSKHDDVELLPHVAVAMARELLAARKVVRAAKALGGSLDDMCEWRVRERLAKSVAAYDKARKG